MAKVESKKELEKVVLFGDELEKRKIDLQECVNLLKKKFENESIEVGKVSYYLLGLKIYGMIDLSYSNIVLIVKKFFESNGMITETSEKCAAYYMRMIKSGKVNIKESFKNSGRKKEIINLDSIIF